MIFVAAAALAAAVVFLQTRPPALYPAQLAHYTIDAQGRVLTVSVALGRLQKIESSRVEEGTRSVKVFVMVSSQSGTVTSDLRLEDVAFTLTNALGDRLVVDDSDTSIPPKRTAPP